METFFRDLAAALSRAGFEVKYSEWSITVSGCLFAARSTRKDNVIYFLGERYKNYVRGGWDISRAAVAVIQMLPSRLKEKERADAHEQAKQMLKDMYPDAKHGTYESTVTPKLKLEARTHEFVLKWVCYDPMKLGLVVDFIQELK